LQIHCIQTEKNEHFLVLILNVFDVNLPKIKQNKKKIIKKKENLTVKCPRNVTFSIIK